MKHPPSVYIAGKLMPCEFSPANNAVVLDDLRIPWGRDSLYSPTNPSECYITVLDPAGSWASDPALFGAELRIDTDLGVLFRGRIDGITMEPVTIGGDPNPNPPTGWAPPPQPRHVWQVEITATDVIAQLASIVAPGYETTTTVPEQLEVLRSDWGPGFWDRADTQSRLQAIENRIKSLGIDLDVEAIDFATITPPGVPYWAYFREPYRRAQADLYTMVQSVQMRSNEPIHSNYIPGTKVLAEGGFPDAAALILTYANSVIDVARDPAYGLAYMIDCNAVALDGTAAVSSTVEQSIGSIRVTQSDYSVQSYTQNNKTFQVVKFGHAQVNRVIAGGVASYEPTAMDISNESILYSAPTGQVQSQTADAFAASIAPSIQAVNGKLIPPPLTFSIDDYDFGSAVEAVIMATYTPDNGAFAFPGAVYEPLTGWGSFFQMIGGELRFRQGWDITIQFAPSPTAASGGLTISQLVTNATPTFDQYATRVSLSTLGTVTKGVS